MKTEDRKAAIAAWKERKTVAGIYAVRAPATGQVWVGATTTLDKAENRLWFTLKHGISRPVPAHAAWNDLQAAWDACGPEGLSFETVEELDEKAVAYGGRTHLRERLAHWAEKLAASVI